MTDWNRCVISKFKNKGLCKTWLMQLFVLGKPVCFAYRGGVARVGQDGGRGLIFFGRGSLRVCRSTSISQSYRTLSFNVWKLILTVYNQCFFECISNTKMFKTLHHVGTSIVSSPPEFFFPSRSSRPQYSRPVENHGGPLHCTSSSHFHKLIFTSF